MGSILLAEDDVLLVRLYQRKFAHDGFDVRVAMDGQEALLAIMQEKPDLILLDIMMPKLNGLEVLERLKKNVETKGIPVIVLSNLSRGEDINRALELGAAAYLLKSDTLPSAVVAKVKEVLAASSKGRGIPKAVPTGKDSRR